MAVMMAEKVNVLGQAPLYDARSTLAVTLVTEKAPGTGTGKVVGSGVVRWRIFTETPVGSLATPVTLYARTTIVWIPGVAFHVWISVKFGCPCEVGD